MFTSKSLPFRVLIALIAMTLASCKDDPGQQSPQKDYSIIMDVQFYGYEGTQEVTGLVSFHSLGNTYKSIFLPHPARIEIDGMPFTLDSSSHSGVYFHMTSPLEEFWGEHILLITDEKGKQYQWPFHFPEVRLKTEIPAELTRSDLQFQLEGLSDSDRVRVFLEDTAFRSVGINRLDSPRNGAIHVSRAELEDLNNGPIQLELSREVSTRMQLYKPFHGSLGISYGIDRRFILKD